MNTYTPETLRGMRIALTAAERNKRGQSSRQCRAIRQEITKARLELETGRTRKAWEPLKLLPVRRKPQTSLKAVGAVALMLCALFLIILLLGRAIIIESDLQYSKICATHAAEVNAYAISKGGFAPCPL
jgi:hypothetical protein